MRSTIEKAWGKLNLTLDVLGVRPDGYHEMQMIMQSVDLCDDVTITLTDKDDWSCGCDCGDVPVGQENLTIKAANNFFDRFGNRPAGLEVFIHKNIPMQGGMAGGSSDAAAVLRGLNRLCDEPFSLAELADIGASVGSDVPYCIMGGTMLAEGRGEVLTPLPAMPDCYYVLVRPDFAVSTPELFRALDSAEIKKHPDTRAAIAYLKTGDLVSFCTCMHNVFQPVLEQKFPVIDDICTTLNSCGALGASLTGTGSVVYGIFRDKNTALMACGLFQKNLWACLAQNV